MRCSIPLIVSLRISGIQRLIIQTRHQVSEGVTKAITKAVTKAMFEGVEVSLSLPPFGPAVLKPDLEHKRETSVNTLKHQGLKMWQNTKAQGLEDSRTGGFKDWRIQGLEDSRIGGFKDLSKVGHAIVTQELVRMDGDIGFRRKVALEER